MTGFETTSNLSGRYEHLRMKSGLRLRQATFPGALGGAEVAVVTHYEADTYVTGGRPDVFLGFRVLRAAGNDESDP